MYKALIAGCGNIGAMYDWDTDDISTHAKAFACHGDFTLSFFDTDTSQAEKVAARYGGDIVPDLEVSTINEYDCFSICTPTSTHFELLGKALDSNVQVIVCEKPVAASVSELNEIADGYKASTNKILVNYIRRFLPAYQRLKEVIETILTKEKMTNISIRYQRGFINNCSHAFDLIEYLTSSTMELENIQFSNRSFDHFMEDPTVSLMAYCKNINVNVTGISNVLFSHFEIDIFFQYSKVEIKNGGAVISIRKADKGSEFLRPLPDTPYFLEENALKNYMKPIVTRVHSMLTGKLADDNFLSSINMNLRMLQYLHNNG